MKRTMRRKTNDESSFCYNINTIISFIFLYDAISMDVWIINDSNNK